MAEERRFVTTVILCAERGRDGGRERAREIFQGGRHSARERARAKSVSGRGWGGRGRETERKRGERGGARRERARPREEGGRETVHAPMILSVINLSGMSTKVSGIACKHSQKSVHNVQRE